MSSRHSSLIACSIRIEIRLIKAPAPEKARERVLSDPELGAVLEACASLGAYGQGVKLLALTGARRSEVFGMTWAEVDMTGKAWTLPAARAKNGRMHNVPLSDAAVAILMELGTNLVPSSEPGRVFGAMLFSRMKGELDKLLPCGFAAWCSRGTSALATIRDGSSPIAPPTSGRNARPGRVQRDHPGSNQRRDALLRAGGAIAKPRLGPGAQPGRSVIR